MPRTCMGLIGVPRRRSPIKNPRAEETSVIEPTFTRGIFENLSPIIQPMDIMRLINRLEYAGQFSFLICVLT